MDRLSPSRRIEHEAGSLAPVLDLDAKFIRQIPAIPEQVDDDSVGLAVSEVISRG